MDYIQLEKGAMISHMLVSRLLSISQMLVSRLLVSCAELIRSILAMFAEVSIMGIERMITGI